MTESNIPNAYPMSSIRLGLEDHEFECEEGNLRGFCYTFNAIQELVHDMARNNGFWPETDPSSDPPELFLAKLMLTVGELSEAMEAFRAEGLTGRCEKPIDILALEEEFADVHIRLMDLAQRYQLNVSRAIIKKALYNASRPFRHGKSI